MSTTSLAYAVCIAMIINLLSVDALRCHQCNSHSNEDCSSLLVNTPRAQRDDQFLKDCAPRGEKEAFCRKTVLKFEVNGEHRIERGCGWIEEKMQNACFTADNEGYKQTICTCNEEGCNAATSLLGAHHTLAAAAISLLIVHLIRH
ncbi:U-scoloptoxin(05)-Er3a [Drosophila subobscura]|uniref:U-scoloptoxin(05)-Er3a n=1 Tax=Drosophila subobscura TaxID=7241 RepID=UPI00155AF837|nr:U-scoloptoxin(05)-Er3a [Drosophila subobscura]